MIFLTDIDGLDPSEVGDPLLRPAEFAVGFLLVVIVGWFVVEPAISRIVRRRNRNNPTLDEAITRYLRLIILILGVIVGLSAAGFMDVVGNSALVVAAVTLSISIAGQSVIGSLVSGSALVIDSEFNVGNYIEWEGGEGVVTSITLRTTRVRTPDGGLVTIPNTTLTDEAITKPFFENDCRTLERITIAYEDDVGTALELLAEIAADIDGIPDEPTPRVGVDELGDDGVILRAEYWIENPIRNRFPIRSQFAKAVKERFERAGIDISPRSEHDLEGRIRIEDEGGS